VEKLIGRAARLAVGSDSFTLNLPSSFTLDLHFFSLYTQKRKQPYNHHQLIFMNKNGVFLALLAQAAVRR
jgi:hypothetical protein